MLLTDVQPYDSYVLHLSIATKTYWWHQLLPNGGNSFVRLIYCNICDPLREKDPKRPTIDFWIMIVID